MGLNVSITQAIGRAFVATTIVKMLYIFFTKNAEAEADYAATRRPIYTIQRRLERLWVSKRRTMP